MEKWEAAYLIAGLITVIVTPIIIYILGSYAAKSKQSELSNKEEMKK